jgi:hypothetical protein
MTFSPHNIKALLEKKHRKSPSGLLEPTRLLLVSTDFLEISYYLKPSDEVERSCCKVPDLALPEPTGLASTFSG